MVMLFAALSPVMQKKAFLKVILIECLIDLRGKQRPSVGADEMDE